MKKISFQGATWDSVFLTFVKFATTFTAIIQTKILSVGLSLTDYGTYSQVNVVISIATSLLLLGLGDAINYFYNNRSEKYGEAERRYVVHTVYAIEIAAGIVLVGIMIIFQDYIISYFSNTALKTILIIVSIKPMLDNLIYFYQILFVSVGKAKLIAFRNLAISILKLIAIFIAVHIFKSIKVIFVALILLDILQLIFFAAFFSRDGFVINPFFGKKKYIKEILAYGLPMGIFSLTNMLTRDIDKLIIGNMADTETLAIYTNCSKVLPFDIIVASFATVLIPYIMKYITADDRDSSISLLKNYLKIGYYSVWIFGTAVLIVSDQAISFLYSDEYLAGKTVFIMYVIDSMIKFASMHLILTASGKTRMLMIYSLISLIVNTVLNVMLFKIIGITGPAAATLIVAIGYAAVILHNTIKILKAKWAEIFDVKDLVRFVFTLCITGLLFGFINQILLKFGMNKYMAMIGVMGCFSLCNLLLYLERLKRVFATINKLKL